MTELDHYDYELPAELIAQQPLRTRSDARLLLVDRARDSLSHAHVRDLPDLLDPGDCLVVNNSRVIPARLVGYRTDTGGRWQGLFLGDDQQGTWRLLSKTRGRLQSGTTVTLIDRQSADDIRLRMLTRLEEGQWAARPQTDEATMTILQRVGRVPLPHYIREGEMIEADWEAYQTVYASQPGSVAAPTAGLHFTSDLLRRLDSRAVAICQITLHVGLGTFRPIATDTLAEHQMHSEWGSIDQTAVDQLQAVRDAGARVIAVGSTSMRMLETASATGQLVPWSGQTDLFIRPSHTFRVVDGLMTNFHLPRSTLLVLVRTFGGDRLIRQAYEAAIEQRYRFFSYGDAMLIL
jgi:S-adenosylmethionine:tRNA ribosyltransferase-isomerase